jgi:hypothetical protein
MMVKALMAERLAQEKIIGHVDGSLTAIMSAKANNEEGRPKINRPYVTIRKTCQMARLLPLQSDKTARLYIPQSAGPP